MTYNVDNSREDIVIYKLVNALNKLEVTRLISEIEKNIAEGRIKIIIDFSKEAATGSQGFGYIQKAFIRLRGIAQKMQGDILYVLPQKIADRVEGGWGELPHAIQMLTAGITTDEKQRDLERYKEQIAALQAKVASLTAAAQLLAKKNQEFALMLSQPNTNEELQAAVDHYRKLASEVQIASPSQRTLSKKPLA